MKLVAAAAAINWRRLFCSSIIIFIVAACACYEL